jgi:hypothetical protein
VDGLEELVPHILHLVTNLLDQSPPPFNLIDLEAEPIWIMLNSLDTLHEISEIGV